MSEVEISEEQTTAVVRDRARKPAGLLPKNTQAMVIATISLIMVGAIAFSGGSSPKASGKSPLPPSPSVVDVNQARIAEYRERLDEQARKLAAEQAQFQQAKQQFSGPSAQGSSFSTGSPEGPAGRSEDQNIEDDRKKRAYMALFSSNVALSYRKGGSPGTENGSVRESIVSSEPAVRSASVSPGNRQDQDVNSATPQSFAHPPEAARDNEDNQAENPNRRKADTQPSELSQSEGKLYRLFEGTLIETVLTNRLNGSFVGPVNCMVTANLYSHDGQQMLIPQGTRVLGEAKRVTVFGQERLAVVFHRLIMPDGYSVSLDHFRGLSQMGETGLRDQIHHHYAEIFGVSLALGAIAGFSQANTRSGVFASAADAYRQGVSDSVSQSSLRILDRYLNILPTITIREGHRVKVYLSDDLLLPAYQNHRLREDL